VPGCVWGGASVGVCASARVYAVTRVRVCAHENIWRVRERVCGRVRVRVRGRTSVCVCANIVGVRACGHAHTLVASACVCELIACARTFCVRECARVRACAGVLATHLAVLATKSSTECLLFSSPKRVTPWEYTGGKEKQQRYPNGHPVATEVPYQRYPVEKEK
jgi:hypothetical protein